MMRNSVWLDSIAVRIPSRGESHWDVEYSMRYDKESDQLIYKIFFGVAVTGKVASKNNYHDMNIIKSLHDSNSGIRNSFEKKVLSAVSSKDVDITKDINGIINKTMPYILKNSHHRIFEITEKGGLFKKIEDSFKISILFPSAKSKRENNKNFPIFLANTEETKEILYENITRAPHDFSPAYSMSDFEEANLRWSYIRNIYKAGDNYYYEFFSIAALGLTVTLPNFTEYFTKISEKMNIKYTAFLDFGSIMYPTFFFLIEERGFTSEIEYVESLNLDDFGTVFFNTKIMFKYWRLYSKPHRVTAVFIEPVLKKSMLRNILHDLFGEWKNQDEIETQKNL